MVLGLVDVSVANPTVQNLDRHIFSASLPADCHTIHSDNSVNSSGKTDITISDALPWPRQGRRQGAGGGLAPYGPQISIEHLNFD